MRSLHADITVKGVTFQVTYFISGENRPATETDPHERTEAVLDSVSVGGEEITSVVSDSVLDKIEEKLQELI